jgi:glutamine---fructose-6-phosphate transaminase (isomerizing)
MCGIVGAIGERNILPVLLDGLLRLEYRGYDSAGVALINAGKINRQRCAGKVSELVNSIDEEQAQGKIGIAHTRWATHGEPNENNAHPHLFGSRIALVHNGIIENYKALAQELKLQANDISSDTDSEIIAACIYNELHEGEVDLFTAVNSTIARLRGAYAIAVIDVMDPDTLIVAREGSPLVVGMGVGEHFIASDPLALQKLTQEFIYLQDGDVAKITRSGVECFDRSGSNVSREIKKRAISFDVADKGSHKHYMHKEIFEQPQAIEDTISDRISNGVVVPEVFGSKAKDIFANVRYVQIIACGTSYHAGVVGRYWIEEFTGLPCNVEIASEFRYRRRAMPHGTLIVAISQSGETADTLAALADVRGDANLLGSLAICNVPESSLMRCCDLSLLTHAGPEIGVATTKGFTTQLVGLYMLTNALAGIQNIEFSCEDLRELPQLVTQMLAQEDKLKDLAHKLANKNHVLFLGRGMLFPIALEGALKLKELSYIHAEAYPAGELKHGPLALVDEDMPVIFLLPEDRLFDKVTANISEVSARGGEVFVFGAQSEHAAHHFQMPKTSEALAPVVYSIPLQLLSYYVAVLKGTDVDQPRNLAKSVTVE